MKIDPTDGMPLVGTRRNMLGVRPTDPTNTNPKRRFDVEAVLDSDPIQPGTEKGLSVSSDLAKIAGHAQNDEAVWEIDTVELGMCFLTPIFSPGNDPNSSHYVLETSRDTTLAKFQEELASTRDLWTRV